MCCTKVETYVATVSFSMMIVCNKMCDRSMLNVCVMSECDDVSVGGDAECVMWVCVGVYCCVRVCGYQLYAVLSALTFL